MPQHKTAQKPSGLPVHIGYCLRLVSNRVSGAFARALQEQRLSVAEWVALNQIDGASQLTSADLAEAIGMTRGAISKILEKLEKKGCIAREVSMQDSRSQYLSLTRHGRQLLPELTKIADSNDAHFFGALELKEQAQLRRLLHKLAQAHQISEVAVE